MEEDKLEVHAQVTGEKGDVSAKILWISVSSIVALALGAGLVLSATGNGYRGFEPSDDFETYPVETAEPVSNPTIYDRLRSQDSAWIHDPSRPLNPIPGFIEDYLYSGETCNISVYEDEDAANYADENGLAINLGVGWIGTDSATGFGVILSVDSALNSCVDQVYKAVGWGK
jgi:hypothetical protein